MTEIISARFRSGGKQYYFDPNHLVIVKGDHLVVETGKGQDLALCTRSNWMIEEDKIEQPLRPVVRIATEEDLKMAEFNRRRERDAMRVAQGEIDRHQLDMKLVRVEYAFDGSKVIFFFTADGRVDFRALVRDLASIFRCRIELRQIGIRDEARMLGGIGICGKPFCCSQFLGDFQPVSIKMAKTQKLSLNPTKISGTCGRLMCCLNYEEAAYEDAINRCPKIDSFVECPDGVGEISQVDLLREMVKVKLENTEEQPRAYHNDEIRIVRPGPGRRPDGYEPPPKAELEKLRREQDPRDRKRFSGWHTSTGEDLSVALERYLEEDSPAREEKKSRTRREKKSKPKNQKRRYPGFRRKYK